MSGRAVAKKSEKFFVKLGQEEFLDVESVQQSQVLALRRVNCRRVDSRVVRPAEGRQGFVCHRPLRHESGFRK